MINERKFMFLMSFLLGAFSIVYLGINFIFTERNVNIINLFLLLINIISILIIFTIIFSMISTYLILKDKDINVTIMKVNFKIISILYPIIIFMSEFFKISKSDIRTVYVYLNNKYIYSNKYNIDANDIMLLTPHCIQKNFCKHKVTNDIENCKRCGKCNVNDLIMLKEKYNIKPFVATGGTLARKIILDNKPKAVIAIACERDLTSGIQDISKIPVVGVFNKRPNGPCVDTEIDIIQVENAIKFFIRD